MGSDIVSTEVTPANGGLGAAIRRRFVESPTSFGAAARQRRWATVQRAFPELRDMRVVDLGGTVEAWQRAPVQPREVTVVNLFEPGSSADSRLIPVLGDACAARAALVAAGLGTDYDVAFSNSLIEHVGGHAKRLELSNEIRGLAPYHWVQTPYRYFPLEPHWLFPLMQFLPVRARATIAARWPLTHTRPESWTAARDEALWTELVSLTEMRAYFPQSEMYKERIGGLIKSITALRSPVGS